MPNSVYKGQKLIKDVTKSIIANANNTIATVVFCITLKVISNEIIITIPILTNLSIFPTFFVKAMIFIV